MRPSFVITSDDLILETAQLPCIRTVTATLCDDTLPACVQLRQLILIGVGLSKTVT